MRLFWTSLFALAAACDDVAMPTPGSHEVPVSDAAVSDAAAAVVASVTGLAPPTFCDRPETSARATRIDRVFCAGGGAPAITGMRELQRALGLVPFAESADDVDLDASLASENEVVLLGHSTALPAHRVSPINPRAFVIGSDSILAYARGAQEVELVSRAADGSFVFYLLHYAQACNLSDQGCAPGDLYTPATESDWHDVTVRDDTELTNTPLDCRVCHARGTERASLLMREVDGPWTHFFDTVRDTGGTPEVKGYQLLDDYVAAKGGERYADIELSRYKGSAAQALEIAVGLRQPLYFDALAIERERWPFRTGEGYAAEPAESPTWQAAYEAWKRGEQLPLPHFDPRPTAADKQARLTDAYARYRAGELAASELPDLADIFPDDPLTRAQIGLTVEPDAAPVDALIQACGSCHNAVLDQSVSRARFSIDLQRMDAGELALAVQRLELPRDAPGAMPPAGARALTPEVRDRLVAFLREEGRAGQRDAQLEHAAEMGMRGGSRPRRP